MTTSASVLNLVVPGMTCGHCVAAVTEEVSKVSGVAHVAIDLDTKLVVVTGTALDESLIRDAIREAGYEADREAVS